MFRGVAGRNRQRLRPVLPVAVLNLDGDRRTDRLAVANSGEEMSRILLDAHAAAASVALLAAPEFAIHTSILDRNAGRHSRKQRDQALAVRLSCGGKT